MFIIAYFHLLRFKPGYTRHQRLLPAKTDNHALFSGF